MCVCVCNVQSMNVIIEIIITICYIFLSVECLNDNEFSQHNRPFLLFDVSVEEWLSLCHQLVW